MGRIRSVDTDATAPPTASKQVSASLPPEDMTESTAQEDTTSTPLQPDADALEKAQLKPSRQQQEQEDPIDIEKAQLKLLRQQEQQDPIAMEKAQIKLLRASEEHDDPWLGLDLDFYLDRFLPLLGQQTHALRRRQLGITCRSKGTRHSCASLCYVRCSVILLLLAGGSEVPMLRGRARELT